MSTIEKIALALDCSFVNFISEYIVLYDTFEFDQEQGELNRREAIEWHLQRSR